MFWLVFLENSIFNYVEISFFYPFVMLTVYYFLQFWVSIYFPHFNFAVFLTNPWCVLCQCLGYFSHIFSLVKCLCLVYWRESFLFDLMFRFTSPVKNKSFSLQLFQSKMILNNVNRFGYRSGNPVCVLGPDRIMGSWASHSSFLSVFSCLILTLPLWSNSSVCLKPFVALIAINHLHFHLPSLVPLLNIWSVMLFW